jgi:hypothetical protein
MFRTKRQPAPAQPVKTGLLKTKKQPPPAQPVKTGLLKTKKQPPPPMKTGLMSKVKALFSSRKEMTAATPKAKEPVRRK